MNFIASPEIVTAFALGGSLSFNPIEDNLISDDGVEFKLEPPKVAPDVPENGFLIAKDVYIAPAENPTSIEVLIDPNSERLQKLEPFSKWNGQDFKNLTIMIKAKGKCTTCLLYTSDAADE